MDNAAFNDGADTTELCRILDAVKNNVQQCSTPDFISYNCRDINGNKVGHYETTGIA